MPNHPIHPFFAIAVILLAGCAGALPSAVPAPTESSIPTATVAPTTGIGPTGTPDTTPPFAHTACAKGADLAGQTVTFYQLIDLNDELSEFAQPMRAGLEDAAAYFNIHGGICGASLANDFPDPARPYDAPTEYHRLTKLRPKPVLIGVYDSGNAEQLRGIFASDQIPALGIRVGSELAEYGADGKSPGWIFSTNPLYTDQLGVFCQFVSQHPQQYPRPTIGYLSWDGAFGNAAYTPETIAYCRSLGVKFIDPPLYFAQDASDIHALVQKLVDEGANILYTNTLGHGTALIAKTLVEMGLQKTLPLGAVNWAMDTTVGLLGQATPGADGLPSTNGLIGSLPLRTWAETDQPGIELIAEQADLHQRALSMRNNFYILGWASTDLYIELYIQTGNRVGFDHITGAEMKKTLENIVYSPLGGIETVDFKGGTRRALSTDRLVQMAFLGRDGKTPAGPKNPLLLVNEAGRQWPVPLLVPLSDFQPAPDLRPGGADVPALPQPTATVPAKNTTAPTAHIAATGRIVYEGRVGGEQDSDSEIWLINADGSGQIRLTNNQFFDGQPVWSPDGEKIAFVSNRDGSADLFVMNADGSQPVNLTKNPADDEGISWSPDGKKITFVSDRDGNPEVYVMNADGSGQTRLTNNPSNDSFPRFSPDGSHIIFDSDRSGKVAIYVMNPDGSSPTLLTDNSIAADWSAWSPDGKQIVFVSNRNGNNELYRMNVDGSQVTRLTNNPAGEGAPIWSPDGQYIAFDSDRNGSSQLYVMKADGSGQTQLTDSGYTVGWSSWTR